MSGSTKATETSEECEAFQDCGHLSTTENTAAVRSEVCGEQVPALIYLTHLCKTVSVNLGEL